MTVGTRRVRRLVAAIAFLAVAGGLLWHGHVASRAAVVMRPERHRQTSWVACNRNARSKLPSTFHPLSDAAAAAPITPERETRPDNARPFSVDGALHGPPNDYVPTAGQIAAVRRARTQAGQSILAFNPYYADVDGHDGLRHPSTDDLIQWAAHKWGIPEDWLRAEYAHESWWNQYMLYDDTPVPAAWEARYPSQARLQGTHDVLQSMGIAQVRWSPDGALNAGTEPLRWLSTAFNIDWQAATLRFYYDNPSGSRSAWNDPSYQPCQKWQSIGGWYRPYPWGNADQRSYVAAVQALLAQRVWSTASFVGWSHSSLPPGLKLR